MRVYTDGSCRFQVGGWAWWCEESNQHESGVEFPSTNQRMELYAALDAVDTFMTDSGEELIILSDSRYLVDCFCQRWFMKWQDNDWKNRKGEPVKNVDIWKPLIDLVLLHGNVKFVWVPGHAGVMGNERADALATSAVRQFNEGEVVVAGRIRTEKGRLNVVPK